MTTFVEDVAERQEPTRASARRRWWQRLPDPLVTVVVFAIALFAVAGIGSPVWGRTSMVETGLLNSISPYRDGQLLGVAQQTRNLGDTVDGAIPNEALFGDAARDGEYASWNPYILGGTPLGGNPNQGVVSPLTLPFLVLPAWLAPAYVKLLEILVAVGGCYLFLRRLRLGRPAALLGGLGFATSAFLVAWTNWPQAHVAAFIPAFFWSLECLIQQRRARDVALVSLTVAAMLLGGFPAVTGYALLTGGIYLVVRAVAVRRVVGLLAAGAAGVLAGVALVAVQLLPWITYMSTVLVRGREQTPDQHIPPELLLTAIAPYAFGSPRPSDPPYWFHIRVFLEEVSYVGAAVLVLAIVAVALARAGRSLLPKSTWAFLVAATLSWGVVVYLGGAPLWLLQRLPYLFSDNSVERARSVLGFLVAVLAAVGFDLLLRRAKQRTGRLQKLYGAGVWAAVGIVGVVVYVIGRRWAAHTNHGPSHVHSLNMALLAGFGFVALALAGTAFLWWGPRWPAVRLVAAALIPVLVAVQALIWVRNYYPRTERENFYPYTEVHAYLQEHLGHERFTGTDGAVLGGVHIQHRLRALHGHSFVDKRFAELLEAMPGPQFHQPPRPATSLRPANINGYPPTSPILDLLSVTQFVTPPEQTPYGEKHQDNGDGSTVLLHPDRPTAVAVPVRGPLRGIAVTPTDAEIHQTLRTRISVTLRDSAGRVVAEASRLDRKITPGQPFFVPLAAENVPAGAALTAQITLHNGPAMAVAGRAGRPAVSAVSPVDDGLRLVFDDSSVIYERTRALPRVRWASRATVETDPQRRLALLADGTVPGDEVLLDRPGPAATGAPADVEWLDDGLDEMSVAVDAKGAGYLVIADAIRETWRVTVDGRPAELVPADHGIAAVAVPAGRHVVQFSYAPRMGTLGVWISALTALLLFGAVLIEWWYRRRPIHGQVNVSSVARSARRQPGKS